MDKGLPDTLCAEDLRAYDPRHTLQRALRAPVVVLVAGDVAQTVSAEGERSARFLYAGNAGKFSAVASYNMHITWGRLRVRREESVGLDAVRGARGRVHFADVLRVRHDLQQVGGRRDAAGGRVAV